MRKSNNRTRLNINTMRSWQTSIRNEIATTIKSKDFVQIWSSYDDIFISTNSDYMTPALRKYICVKSNSKITWSTSSNTSNNANIISFPF